LKELARGSRVLPPASGGASRCARRKSAAFVAIDDLDFDAAERTAAGVRARGARAISARVDVRHRAELDKFADLGWAQANGIELLFNNAGVARVARARSDDACWKRVRKGWICNAASEAGVPGGTPYIAAYTATKHGVVGYSNAVRADYSGEIGVSMPSADIVASSMWNTGAHRPAEFGGRIAHDPAAKPIWRSGAYAPKRQAA
jgi:NADP-dependent 3-hydroxy acid dehydrogenase YdfG